MISRDKLWKLIRGWLPKPPHLIRKTRQMGRLTLFLNYISKLLLVFSLAMLVTNLVLTIPSYFEWGKNSIFLLEEEWIVGSKRSSVLDCLLYESFTLNSSEKYTYRKSVFIVYYSYPTYLLPDAPFITIDAENVRVRGEIRECSSPPLPFNFYVFDEENFELWKANKNYTCYFKVFNRTSVTFTFPLKSLKKQGCYPLYFVVERCVDAEELIFDIKAYLYCVYESDGIFFVGVTPFPRRWYLDFIFRDVKDFVIKGTVMTMGNSKFNFYIMDETNFYNFKANKSYTVYFEAKNITKISFNVPIRENQTYGSIFFVTENCYFYRNVKVKLSAVLEWDGRLTLAGILLNNLGGFVFVALASFSRFIITHRNGWEDES